MPRFEASRTRGARAHAAARAPLVGSLRLYRDPRSVPVRRSAPRRSPLQCAAVLLVAAFGVALAASSLAAQNRYPESKPGAPPGVYAAPLIALDSLETMLSRDSLDYGANWRAARALTTLGALAGDARRNGTRDERYRRALTYARRAARIQPDAPEGHWTLADLLARRFDEARMRDRARLASEIFAEVNKVLELDPSHDGALYALGRWHMNVSRLSRLERFLAIRFLGGEVMQEASQEAGVSALERAVAIRPSWIQYRLDLARAYFDVERLQDAQAQLDAIAALEPIDPEDAAHQREAKRLANWIAAGGASWPRALVLKTAEVLRRP